MTRPSAEATTRKPRGAQASNPAAAGRVKVMNVNVPGCTLSVDAALYSSMKKALLKVLPAKAPGLTHAEMLSAVVLHLPADLFPGGGKAGWWVKCAQLDLEAKRQIVCEPSKRLRWHKRAGG